MNFKTTGLLLGLLIVVGLVWLLFPRGQTPADVEPPPSPRAPATTDLLDPRPKDEDIVRVEVERPGQPRLVLERSAANAEAGVEQDWRMVEPLAAQAESFKVSGLIRTLTGLQSQSRYEPGAAGAPTAADAGLEPPAATITLVDAQGKRTAVQIGKKAAMSNDTYVRLAERPTIHVVARDLRPQVQERIQDYRAKRLLRFKPDEVVRARIEHDGRTYDFSRSGAEWVINEPTRAYADGAKLRSKLLSPLSMMQAADFVEDAPTSLTPYGLDEPFLTVTLTTEHRRTVTTAPSEAAETQPAEVRIDTQTHVVRIGGFADLKNERRYAQTDAGPAVVAVGATEVAGLVPNLNELRDPRVTRLKAADLTEISLILAGQTAVLRKSDGTWRIVGDAGELDDDAVKDFVTAIEELSAISTIDEPEAPATYGLDVPRAELAISATGRVTPLVLRIGGATASGRNAYVQLADQPGVVVVSEAQAARLAVNPPSLRSREVFGYALERLQRIRVERDGGAFLIERDGEGWALREPTDTPLNVAAARALAQDLARLRARTVVARDEPARYGLEPPAVTIRFEVTAPAPATVPASPEAAATESHVLRVGRANGVAYAHRDDDPLIFELDESVWQSLTAELIEPRVFAFTADAVQRVQIVATGGTLELARQGERWIYVPDPFVALDQKKVQDFVHDLAELRVETWLAYHDGDLAAAGLESAPASVRIELTDGTEAVMTLTQEQPGDLPRRAGLPAERRIFRLRPADAEKILRGLNQYLPAAAQ